VEGRERREGPRQEEMRDEVWMWNGGWEWEWEWEWEKTWRVKKINAVEKRGESTREREERRGGGTRKILYFEQNYCSTKS
jgi:hypothetical protein